MTEGARGPGPRALERAMADLLRLAAPVPQGLTVRSDEHPAHPRAFRRRAGCAIRHERTPSVAARTPGKPLLPVNLLDLLLRHNGAHHKRESIAFAKRHQTVIERSAPSRVAAPRHPQSSPHNQSGLQCGPPTCLLPGGLVHALDTATRAATAGRPDRAARGERADAA